MGYVVGSQLRFLADQPALLSYVLSSSFSDQELKEAVNLAFKNFEQTTRAMTNETFETLKIKLSREFLKPIQSSKEALGYYTSLMWQLDQAADFNQECNQLLQELTQAEAQEIILKVFNQSSNDLAITPYTKALKLL
jgi:secreted Zn-dependent insulinase-like peptidase